MTDQGGITWTGIITTAATVAVAWTAIQSLRRERKRDRERRKRADARIRTDAHELANEIPRLLEGWPPSQSGPGDRIQYARDHRDAFEGVLDTARDMANEAPQATDAVGREALRIHSDLIRAVVRLRDVARSTEVERLPEAREALEACTERAEELGADL